jgi:hypothetical protein
VLQIFTVQAVQQQIVILAEGDQNLFKAMQLTGLFITKIISPLLTFWSLFHWEWNNNFEQRFLQNLAEACRSL